MFRRSRNGSLHGWRHHGCCKDRICPGSIDDFPDAEFVVVIFRMAVGLDWVEPTRVSRSRLTRDTNRSDKTSGAADEIAPCNQISHLSAPMLIMELSPGPAGAQCRTASWPKHYHPL